MALSAENYRFFRGNLLKIGLNPLVFGLFYAILAAVSYTHLTLPTICSV